MIPLRVPTQPSQKILEPLFKLIRIPSVILSVRDAACLVQNRRDSWCCKLPYRIRACGGVLVRAQVVQAQAELPVLPVERMLVPVLEVRRAPQKLI